MRALVLLHRYLGVAVGLVMTMWCLSGVVMMYVAYPELAPDERLRGLAPLELGRCCAGIGAEGSYSGFAVEMAAGRAVLRFVRDDGAAGTIAFATGTPLPALGPREAASVARGHAARTGIGGAPRAVERIEKDQWTVQHFRRHQPLYRISFDDPAGNVLYVAGGTGEIVQRTSRRARFWNWLGAIPHWLYPTILRQDRALWTSVVVWTSLLGCFLTVTGIAVGIARLGRRKRGGATPYRGLWAWHHVVGLAAGLLTLGWVASGLLSMTPWGLLESDAASVQRQRLNGAVAAADIRHVLAALRPGTLPPDTVRLEAAPLAGRLFVIATARDGRTLRLDGEGRPAPLSAGAVRAALDATGARIARFEALAGEDDHYYRRKREARPPVYRAILADGQGTRLYVDRATGMLRHAADRPARAYRWLHHGLHSLDFAALRGRPMWDGAMLVLLAGVTFVCATGCWMGLRRIRTDLRRRRRRVRKVAPAIDKLDWKSA